VVSFAASGTPLCRGTTNVAGSASCSLPAAGSPPLSAGAGHLTATFDGDAHYLPAEAATVLSASHRHGGRGPSGHHGGSTATGSQGATTQVALADTSADRRDGFGASRVAATVALVIGLGLFAAGLPVLRRRGAARGRRAPS
jgi:hypothetical protein